MSQSPKITIDDDSYIVFYADHEKGSPAGMMVRQGLERAQQSERLMGECGYRYTEIKHAFSTGEIWQSATK